MDNSIIEESKQSLIKEERLILPIRKKIWLGFGEIKMTDTYAQKTIALISRVKLSMKCIYHIENMWKENDYIKLSFLCDSINKYIDGTIHADELKTVSIRYRNVIQNLSSRDCSEEYITIAMACYYTANVALYDEMILYNTDDEDVDEELDVYTWDTAYLISLLHYTEERKNDLKSYWEWYILTAEQLFYEQQRT